MKMNINTCYNQEIFLKFRSNTSLDIIHVTSYLKKVSIWK